MTVSLPALAARLLAGPGGEGPTLAGGELMRRGREWAAALRPGATLELRELEHFQPLSLPEVAAGQAHALVLVGEWLLQPGPADDEAVPVRAHLLAIAARVGWEPVGEQPLGDAWTQRLERLAQRLADERAALTREGVDVAGARRALRQRLQGLAEGRRQAVMLCLQRQTVPAQQLVAIDEARSPAMRQLFADVFRHPMSPQHWQWKYQAGGARAVGLVEGGELVAHYGGLPRAVRAFGRPAMACQVCDVMVAPRARRSLARQGPMFRIAATFLETQIGWALPQTIGFGFPSARHQGAADRMRLYEAVDRMVQLAWPSEPATLTVRLQRLTLADEASWRKAVNALWGAMAAAMTEVVLGVRDADWLRWRFLERPEVDYELTLLRSRWLRRPLGVIVTRRRDDALELLDVVAPPRHFGLLLAQARALAAAAGLPQLRCWITASQQRRLTGLVDAMPLDLSIDVPACAHTAGPDPATLRGRWFLLGGDADFT